MKGYGWVAEESAFRNQWGDAIITEGSVEEFVERRVSASSKRHTGKERRNRLHGTSRLL
jgi:hypothetical protein